MTEPRGIALITGAGGGIGLSTAGALADDGWQVIATVRNPAAADALRELATRRTIDIRELDVTSRGATSAFMLPTGSVNRD